MVNLALTPTTDNNSAYRKPLPNPENKPSWNETWSAQMEYNYGAIGNALDNFNNFLNNQNAEFDPEWGEKAWNLLSGEDKRFLPYKTSLLSTMNEHHYYAVRRQIERKMEADRTMANAGIVQNGIVSLADPINLVTLPIGGFASSSFIKAGAFASAKIATPIVGLEMLNAKLDPTRTTSETTLNISTAIGTAFLLGGALNKLKGRNADLLERIDKERTALVNDLNNIPPSKFNDAFNDTRAFKNLSNEELNVNSEKLKEDLGLLNDFINVESGQFRGKPFKREGSDKLLDNPEIVDLLKRFDLDPEQTVEKLIDGAKLKKADFEQKIFDIESEFTFRRIENSTQGKDMWNIMDNWFTNSPFFKAVSTPLKRSLQSKQLKGASNTIKKFFIDLAGDSALNFRATKLGIVSGQSVFQKSAVTKGKWVKTYDRLYGLFGEAQAKTPIRVMDYHLSVTGKRQFNEWLTEINRKRIFGIRDGNSAIDNNAIRLLDDFYGDWEKELVRSGLLKRGKYLEQELNVAKIRLKEIEDAIAKTDDLSGKSDDLLRRVDLEEELKLQKQKVETIEAETKRNISITEVEPFMPRYWNQEAIRTNRNKFEQILIKHFEKNPEVWVYDKKRKTYFPKTLSTDIDDLAKRAKETTDNILGLRDISDADFTYMGKGVSKSLKFRELDISNKDVYDFIQHDPAQIMKVYSDRMAPKLHMQQTFGTTNIEEITNNLRKIMQDAKVSTSVENAMIRDFVALHDRITGVVIKNPDALNQKIRRALTEVAQLSYLGTAGLASLTDFAKIVMEHNNRSLFKSLFSLIDDQAITLNAKEGRLAGEILEILNADSYLRFSENVINNPFENTSFSKFMAKTRNAFFFVNGLAPITNIAKKFDSMIRVHETIELAVKIKNKQSIPKLDQEKLLRYGLDNKTMIEIANLVDKGVIEKTKVRKVAGQEIGGLYLGNSEAWIENGASKSTLEKFRVSLNSGIQNTILMGTPADKPIAVDGVFYVNKNLGKLFGLPEDKIVKGYSRLESGLGALPFQFYSYSFAALNKITAGFAHGQQKNRVISVLAAMGLGYMGLKLKNIGRPYVMENMSVEDKIARAFDMSGLAALYTDLGYSAGAFMKDAVDYDAFDTLGINRKGPDGDFGDAITTFTGAGTAWAYNILKGMKNFYDGNYDEAASEFLGQTPFMNTLIGREISKDIRNYVEKGRF